jgi:hypothetical protein
MEWICCLSVFAITSSLYFYSSYSAHFPPIYVRSKFDFYIVSIPDNSLICLYVKLQRRIQSNRAGDGFSVWAWSLNKKNGLIVRQAYKAIETYSNIHTSTASKNVARGHCAGTI